MVVLFQFAPREASLSKVVDVHQVQDSCDSRLLEPLDILLLGGVRADAQTRVAYLRTKELAQEIPVGFLDMTVHDPHFVPVTPLARLLESELTSVSLRLLDLHDPAGFSLINEFFLIFACL